MEVIGNNNSIELAHIRDCFFQKDETSYNERLSQRLNEGQNVALVSGETLSTNLFLKLYYTCKGKINKKVTSPKLQNKYLYDLNTLLNNLNKKISHTQEFARAESSVKQIVAETLIEMVDIDPSITETEMIAIENSLNLILSSVKDYQGGHIMTK